VTGEIIVWNREAKFGFVRSVTGKTFYIGHSSFCDSQQIDTMRAGIRVEFEKRRDKSFDNALNAGSFRDDPRIRNHRNPRIVDETKSPVAAKVRVIRESQEPGRLGHGETSRAGESLTGQEPSTDPVVIPEPELETVLAPATRTKPLIELILEKRARR
jgi:cold shock CspA family protein